MSDYIASNGVLIEHTNAGKTLLLSSPGDSWPNPEEHSLLLNADFEPALREFFLKERDDELGRWRWPENPNFVVYLSDDGQAIVFRETTGNSAYLYRGEAEELRRMREPEGKDIALATKAAEAYFDAHPDPKPWHDAKPGEVWLVATDQDPEAPYVVITDDDFTGGLAFRGEPGGYGVSAPAIKSGRRIFPVAP